MQNLEIGSFVKSIKGRDKDSIYIVKEILDGKISLIDGKYKLFNKPKIKNIKHVELSNLKAEDLQNKILQNKAVYDYEVREAIKKFKIEGVN